MALQVMTESTSKGGCHCSFQTVIEQQDCYPTEEPERLV